jgi:DNA-3-methyladenine glycosylase II
MSAVRISLPKEFSFELTLTFLKRSPRELLHVVIDDVVIKALSISENIVVFSIRYENNELVIDFLSGNVTKQDHQVVIDYVTEWFDLATDLKPFYKLASEDKLLGDLVKKYYGYRIVGQPDLFESLVWAVLGQQINVPFAYTLKQQFVKQFGESISVNDQTYYLFPKPEKVAQLQSDQLLAIQFSRQKAAYTILIAEAFAKDIVSKEKLKNLPIEIAKTELMKIKGVGNWTANYALMKTFRYPDAFPLEDVGIHNAIKTLKKMKTKPTLDQVKRIFKKYKGWEAYATLYLWKSL